MATIQVRDLPDDVYAEFRRQADAAGQSLQGYMRGRLVEMARHQARKSAMLAEMNELLARDGGSRITRAQILADLDADRRR